MAVQALGGLTTASPALAQATVSQQDLIQILLTELTYQDPLKPVDNREFITQLATFSNLEQTEELNTRLDNLLTITATQQSVGLIGHTVDINSTSGTQTGQVTTITFSGGQALLSIHTTSGVDLTGISPAQVTLVR